MWIGNFQDGPLIASLGLISTGTGLGGQLRGNAISRPKYSIDYTTWFSARSTNTQFSAERSSGGRVEPVICPAQRLEVGTFLRTASAGHAGKLLRNARLVGAQR